MIETISRKYRGTHDSSYRKFRWHSKWLARKGWRPASQRYEQGSWGLLAFLVALALCVVLIGILVFIYLIIVKPQGTLYVAYERTLEDDTDWDEDDEYHWEEDEQQELQEDDLKACPDCAEYVRDAARVCRYCGYRFDQDSAAKQ